MEHELMSVPALKKQPGFDFPVAPRENMNRCKPGYYYRIWYGNKITAVLLIDIQSWSEHRPDKRVRWRLSFL